MYKNQEVNAILKDFYEISGIRISIHDTEFNEIYSYPNQALAFCRCLQQKEEVLKDCRKNDRDAFTRVETTGEVYVYKCRRGLYEAVAPIYHYGVLSGYLMMGQIRDSEQNSFENIVQRATEVLKDKQKATEIAKEVEAIERDKIYSYLNVMTILAEYLTQTSRICLHTGKLPKLVAEYVNQNYKSKITLDILSQKFGCCNSTLTNCFKKEYKMSIMTYLNEVRLEKAKELLEKSVKSNKEISILCGFSDQNYFSKVFSKKFGCSPSAYRTNCRGFMLTE